MILLTADAVVAGDTVLRPGWVLINGDRISGVGQGTPPRTADTEIAGTLVPGFVDIHAHGGGGADFAAGTSEAVHQVVAAHLARGTTSLVASLVTAAPDVLLAQVTALAEHMGDRTLAGIHLEGPYLAAARRGAHDPALLRDPDRAEIAALLAAGRGGVRMMTLAPERPGGLDAVRAVVDGGAVAAVGHTDADARTTAAAFDAGATVATHLFNGMRPLHHREPGPVAAALLDDRVTAELVLDGRHVTRDAAEIVVRLAGRRLALVSDSMAAAGQGDGDYVVGGRAVRVTDGVPWLADGSSLAGSAITLDRAFRRLVREHGAGLPAAARATATTPARALGLTDVGEIRPGARADLVALSDLDVTRVMLAGHWTD